MSSPQFPNKGTIPKLGRVNEICQEWMIREDGAMAYHLQDQEIRQHYSGNKQRNAIVREDLPRARSEQQKEQDLAEQAAAVYRQMLEEQEELDKMLAEQLAQKLACEEKMKKKLEEREGLHAARILQKEPEKPPVRRELKPREMSYLMGSGYDDRPAVHPAFSGELLDNVQHVTMQQEEKSQEEKDEELARMLQEQEGDPEECILERDRLLAIEAQDKELAKVLQERERIKAKKAKERARQKALAKKQQKRQEEAISNDIIMPDDAYSNPADMVLPQAKCLRTNQLSSGVAHPEDYEDNYSVPIDRLDSIQSVPEHAIADYPNHSSNSVDSPTRPSYLNIRPSYKPRLPDPEELCGQQHSNIAMAIDPTYAKQDLLPSPSSYMQYVSPTRSVSSKSSSRSSPSSSSLKEIDAKLDMNNAPPYMPIQGQKRTASLEKRRIKDGCKQQ